VLSGSVECSALGLAVRSRKSGYQVVRRLNLCCFKVYALCDAMACAYDVEHPALDDPLVALPMIEPRLQPFVFTPT